MGWGGGGGPNKQMGWAPLDVAKDPACIELLLENGGGPAAGPAAEAAQGDVGRLRPLLADGGAPDGPPRDGVRLIQCAIEPLMRCACPDLFSSWMPGMRFGRASTACSSCTFQVGSRHFKSLCSVVKMSDYCPS